MSVTLPYFRSAGSGPGVVCIHSNASSSSQWRALLEGLAPRFHVVAPDSYGAGRGPAWPADRTLTLHDEVDLLEPLLRIAGEPACLVGHSYGAAIALKAALLHPGRVRALALYEPTLFSVLEQAEPATDAASGIRHAVAAAAAALEAGDANRAAECFIDYWMGAGAWARLPPERQGPIAASTRHVRGWWSALHTEPTPLDAFRDLRCPVLYMVGGRTTESARAVAARLTRTLPDVQVLEFPELGHMGPITHPDVVNAAIAGFLAQVAA
jgi:pimeloyl-ACP methyl ester carboxylesterase